MIFQMAVYIVNLIARVIDDAISDLDDEYFG